VVGATGFGAFSAAGESLFGKIIAGHLTHSASLLVLLDDFVVVTANVVEKLFRGEPLPQSEMEQITARSASYQKGQELPTSVPVLRDTLELENDVLEQPLTVVPELMVEEVREFVEIDETVSVDAVEDNSLEVATEVTAELVEETAEELPTITVEELFCPMDEDLYKIFVPESGQHIKTIQNFVAHTHGTSQTIEEDVITAIHTLHGSSRLAGVEAMAKLSDVFEIFCNTLLKLSKECDADGVELLDRYASTMQESIQAINTPIENAPEWQTLFDEVESRNQALIASASSSLLLLPVTLPVES